MEKKIVIDSASCKGCFLCVGACPKKIITASGQFNKNGYETVKMTDSEKCTGCALCAVMCPDICVRAGKKV